MRLINYSLRLIMWALFIILFSIPALAQTSVFTYQGHLNDGAAAANGTYQMQFALFDASTVGSQVGSTVTLTSVSVANGVFTVQLDFGASAFPGADRFLEISVKKAADPGYTTLMPRQAVTSTPYAVRSLNATSVETTTAGTSVVNAINDASTNITINENRLPSNLIRILPAVRQDFTSSTNGSDALINLGGNYTINPNNFQSNFRLNTDGGFLITGNVDGDISGTGVPINGAGTRMMWYPRKAAFRAGYINGTQWDDANIGLYSMSMGRTTRSSGDYGFSAGRDTVAANLASVALGDANTASGAYSVALGRGAHTNARQGSFVFGDNSTSALFVYDGNGNLDTTTSDLNGAFLRAGVNNSANWRVSGGFRIFTSSNLSTGVTIQSGASVSNWGQSNAVISTSTGAYLSTSGVWTDVSSRTMKTNFTSVDSRSILQKVINLPITTWNYKVDDPNIRHIGAMAQDFYQLFKVGADDEHLASIDTQGVALAAIQGLNEKVEERTTNLQKENDALKEQIKKQQTTIDALKKLVCAGNTDADICKQ